MKSLGELRSEIDTIDDEILGLLNKRAELSLEVKQTSGGQTALRRGREAQIIKRIVAANTGPFSDEAVQSIYEAIVYNGRGLQLALQISYLGPEGTYSEQAALEMFGTATQLVAKRSFKEVVRALESGDTQIAVLPIENSSEGAVIATHKLLRTTELPIIAEHALVVKHALLSKSDQLNDITTVYAHPQALGQCREWLELNLPKAKLVECASNSQGLELARSKNSAAIADERNSLRFDMNVLAKTINDEDDNTTRFIALARDPVLPTGDDKTSIVCTVHDKPGGLYELLGILSARRISMTRVESQPEPGERYAFFLDFLGHKNDENIAEALKELHAKAANLKVVGSYPREIK